MDRLRLASAAWLLVVWSCTDSFAAPGALESGRERDTESVSALRGEQWRSMRCEERYLPGKEQEFELFNEDRLDSAALSCAMARFLDCEGVTSNQKFEHLAEQSMRSGKWGAAMFGWMVKLNWERFEEYLISRGKGLRPEEIVRLSGPYGWGIWVQGRKSRATAHLKRVLFERAMTERDEEVRRYAMGFVSRYHPTLEEAIALGRRLPEETDTGARQAIIDAQTWHDNPITNRILRTSLKGSLEASIIECLCQYDLIEHNRYDFLPELYSLRQRFANERDASRREEAQRVLKAVRNGIEALEELQRQKAPIAPASSDASGANAGK